MHEVAVWFAGWYPTLLVGARAVVGIVLWFWVVSGAIFALRFSAFVLLERNAATPPLAAAPNLVPFPADRFNRNADGSSSRK
jgi:hypothetical protein